MYDIILRSILTNDLSAVLLRFFTLENGKKLATPLLLCLVCIELSDVVFALDSVPAVFGITEDPFIVYTSNMFAISGLRSLFNVLAEGIDSLKYLDKVTTYRNYSTKTLE